MKDLNIAKFMNKPVEVEEVKHKEVSEGVVTDRVTVEDLNKLRKQFNNARKLDFYDALNREQKLFNEQEFIYVVLNDILGMQEKKVDRLIASVVALFIIVGLIFIKVAV